MSSMEHQEVDLSKPQNQDLIWDLDSMARRELAERFIQLFENRLCVYSESVSQLYTNYNLHFPSEQGRKMVVLPNPYAFHDTLHGIEAVAEIARSSGTMFDPGVVRDFLSLRGALEGLVEDAAAEACRSLPENQERKPAVCQLLSMAENGPDVETRLDMEAGLGKEWAFALSSS